MHYDYSYSYPEERKGNACRTTVIVKDQHDMLSGFQVTVCLKLELLTNNEIGICSYRSFIGTEFSKVKCTHIHSCYKVIFH